jgi:uncharacterized membrane protein YfcA
MSDVETSQPRARSPRIVVDGIIANRNVVRKRGGVVAVAMSASLALIGLILVALPGSLFGMIGYLVLVIALPVLSIAGVPAVSAFTSYAFATLASAAIWFALGQVSALRATRRAVAGWPEWTREFWPLAIGVAIGAVLALALSAIVLGAL